MSAVRRQRGNHQTLIGRRENAYDRNRREMNCEVSRQVQLYDETSCTEIILELLVYSILTFYILM